MSSTEKAPSLWTRDFAIITLGSVVSMFGNSMSGFAMSLMVLDISGSTLLYSVYLAMFTLPQLIMPVLSGGPLLQKKDHLHAGLFLCLSLHFHGPAAEKELVFLPFVRPLLLDPGHCPEHLHGGL